MLTLSHEDWGHFVEGGGVCRWREGGGEAAKSRRVPITLPVTKLTGQIGSPVRFMHCQF